MKKEYIYLLILLIVTIGLTLLLSFLYKQDEVKTSYSYQKLNRITSDEFEGYMLEQSDVIIYISDKTNLSYNKFEKKLINKFEEINLIKNVIYIDKSDMDESLQKKLSENYSYKYNEEELPIVIVINDGTFVESAKINEDSVVETIINYEVFE